MPEDFTGVERVIDVAQIDPKVRHTILTQLFTHLPADSALQLVVDHDPRRLRLQLEAAYGAACRWTYLEEGPDIWRVRLQHGRAASPAQR